MSKRVVVVISEDPFVTHRPVEALRIALGLSAGEHETTVVLLGKSSALLSKDIDDVVDGEILEKYLPSIKQLSIPFVLESGTARDAFGEGFTVSERKPHEICAFLSSTERALVF